MISGFLPAILALIFYVVDPVLGVLFALISPAVIALDSNGDYAEVVVLVVFTLAVYFVRQSITDIDEDK